MPRNLLTTILLSCFFISACASTAPVPTATVTPIPSTQTPTATATLMPVPTVTFTPAPSLPAAVVADVEASLPGYTLQGTTPLTDVGDQLIDPEGRVVPEMKVIPYKFGADGENGWLMERTYMFDGKPFTVYMQKSDIKVMKNSGLDMPALQYIDGQLVPKFVIHTDYASQKKIQTDINLISVQEAIQRVYDSSCVIYGRDGKLPTRNQSMIPVVLGIRNGVFEYDGMKFAVNNKVPKGGYATGSWYEIVTVDVGTNETWVAPATPFYWASVEDGKYTYFGFTNEKGEAETYFIDSGELNVEYAMIDSRSANPYTMFKPTGTPNY